MFKEYLATAAATIRSLSSLEEGVQEAIDLLADCLSSGGKILTCGNGGSAAEAAHFATEFLCRFDKDRPSLAALNLTADGSFMTATGNDYQFDHIFSRQIDGLGRKGDVLVVFTTSGNSKNVIEALRSASTRGMRSIALLGRDGGAAKSLADCALVVPSQVTAHIQEAHQVLLHIICSSVEQVMFPSLGK